MPEPHADSSETRSLLDEARSGDDRAVDHLFRRHRRYLTRVVELRLDPRLNGEEIRGLAAWLQSEGYVSIVSGGTAYFARELAACAARTGGACPKGSAASRGGP